MIKTLPAIKAKFVRKTLASVRGEDTMKREFVIRRTTIAARDEYATTISCIATKEFPEREAATRKMIRVILAPCAPRQRAIASLEDQAKGDACSLDISVRMEPYAIRVSFIVLRESAAQVSATIWDFRVLTEQFAARPNATSNQE